MSERVEPPFSTIVFTLRTKLAFKTHVITYTVVLPYVCVDDAKKLNLLVERIALFIFWTLF